MPKLKNPKGLRGINAEVYGCSALVISRSVSRLLLMTLPRLVTPGL